jgi:hypothetical protein
VVVEGESDCREVVKVGLCSCDEETVEKAEPIANRLETR